MLCRRSERIPSISRARTYVRASILTHDSSLVAPAHNGKRRGLLLIVPAIVLAAATVSFAWSIRDRTPVYHAPANAAVRIDPRSGHVSKATVVGRLPGAVAVGAGSVWIANRGDDTISRLDRSGRVSAVVPLDAQPTALACADGALWATTGTAGELLKIDPEYNRRRQDTQASRRAAAPLRRS